jgi:murein DD-endopeptidase MepM/ murein hydrolase activator NlpD
MNNRETYKAAMSGVRHSDEAIERIFDMTTENTKKKIRIKPAFSIAACLILIVAVLFGGNVISSKFSSEKTDNPLIVKAYANASTGNGSHIDKLHYPTDYTDIVAEYNDSSLHYHGGIDFPCSSDSNIYAAASGTVILAENNEDPGNYYGRYIIIDHGNGLSTLYAHNNKLLVDEGDQVSAGQVIALSGSTGNATGPHCHFEVRVNGKRVNPMDYLK